MSWYAPGQLARQSFWRGQLIGQDNRDAFAGGIETQRYVAAFQRGMHLLPLLLQCEIDVTIVRTFAQHEGLDHGIEEIWREIIKRNGNHVRLPRVPD